MNVGSLTLGALDGLLIGLLAVGLVLVYRSSRFLNLAHGQLGAMPALLLATLVIEQGWGYWPAMVVCLVIGAGTGILVERYLVSKLLAKTKSAVSALLLTVGVTQLLLFMMLIPAVKPDGVAFQDAGYPLPFRGDFVVDGVVFGGQYVAVLVFCPLLIVGLGLFLRYSMMGKMIRAVAANKDAARLSGISPKLVSAVTWGLAGAFSTFSAMLASPGQGSFALATGGASLGPAQLLLALGAAAFGAFVSIPWALAGGVTIGMLNQFTLFETSNGGTARLVVFTLILVVIFVRGRSIGAVFAASGAAIDDRPPARIPARVRERLVVRRHRGLLVGGALFVAVIAPLLPPLNAEGQRFQLAVILVYAAIGVSLTMLIGWAGQLSLGHMAVVGVGAYVGGRLAGEGYGVVALLVVAGVLGAAVMVAIGLPALRVRGLTLAVTTLGLAVVASEWLFRSEWFTGSVTSFVPISNPIPPLRGIDLTGMLPVYWTSLITLAVIAVLASALRRSTPGRLMIAVRDDERVAAAYGVTPTTVKLTALAVSGCFAAMAGVLWANAWQSVSPQQFPPELSLAVLAIPVVGGVGSVAGAVAAAVFLYFPTFFWTGFLGDTLGDTAQLAFYSIFSGLNILVVLLVWPTGIAGAAQRLWERFLEAVDRQMEGRRTATVGGPVLVADDVEVHFGGVRALQGASIEVRPGEIVGLIGPNGAGKSTLINAMSGVLRPDKGTVVLNGDDVTGHPPEIRAALGMGRSFQAASLFPGLTVRETLQATLGARARIGVLSSAVHAPWARRAERKIRAEADALVQRLGLSRWADTLTADLSTGTRRICDLAVQVAGRPKVLLLDEPTAGVAQRETEVFGPLLRRIRDELDCSIVIVEHDMPLLMGVCDRVYAMTQGRVIAEGMPEEIRRDPAVIASYLGTDEVAIARSGPYARGDDDDDDGGGGPGTPPDGDTGPAGGQRRQRPLVAAGAGTKTERSRRTTPPKPKSTRGVRAATAGEPT
jgi:ABC-type branched-subunit amino acid transport system ATPase component/ABC-type branched-subunit amino acid transport system permease subunit